MDLVGGLAAATEALKLVKELREVDKQLSEAELKLRLVDLADRLVDAKQALSDAKEEKTRLLEQIEKLKSKAKRERNLRDRDGLLFELDKQGNEVGEPYCNHCYVKEEKLFRLQRTSWNRASRYDCHNCRFMMLPDSR